MSGTVETKRSYAGQSWAPGLLEGSNVKLTAFLQILARDLADDAEENGVIGTTLELWEHSGGSKGLYFGDTSSLPAKGWAKIATF